MYKQPGHEELLFYMLYTTAAVLSLIGSCYLLFRRANAIAPDITSPIRLRRWTAALFASMTLSHVTYLPGVFLTSDDDILLCNSIGALLDCMIVYPLVIVVLLCMLQDRKRPLWAVAVMVAPLVVGMVMCVVSRSDAFLQMAHGYLLIMGIGLIIYMVREVRRYGRWLRDNYADLEHKEVWQSFLVLAIVLLVFVIYAFTNEGTTYIYAMLVISAILICYLLWRVETLSDLSISQQQSLSAAELVTTEVVDAEDFELPQTIHDKIGPLLQQHCIDTQLYLQHDLTIIQLAKAIGTNRYYLSQYFSRQGITYNTYVNSLRINHFTNLYRKSVASQRSFTARQLAFESGYRNYTTFSAVFKQLKGQTVTAWMHETAQ